MKISLEVGGGSPGKIKSQHIRTKEEIEKAREEKKGVMLAQCSHTGSYIHTIDFWQEQHKLFS